MIFYKTEEEIELLKLSNRLVSAAEAELVSMILPGTKTIDLDKRAEEFIRDNGGVPGFLDYQGFPNTLCISVNDAVVHGIPDNYELQEGDIISVDCGVYMNGFHGDSAYSFGVGEISEEKKRLLKITKESLYKGIEAAVSGNRVGDIGFAVQKHAEDAGFSVVRELVGHGVGRNLHERPEVPNFGRRGRGVKLKEGMCIAIEPMINAGVKEVLQENDGWTIRTQDKKPSAHFEHSIAIRKGKAELLSDFNIIEEKLKTI